MRTALNKAALLGGAALFVLVGKTSAWAQTRSFDIPSEDAVKAIPEFARQAGIQILVPTDQLIGLKTPRVKGDLELHVALQKLLTGTGFTIASDDGQTIALSPPPSLASPRSRPKQLGDASHASPSESDEIVVTAQKKTEELKHVPVPVTVLNTAKLTDTGQVLLRDYFTSVPGLSLGSLNQGNEILSIRGIRTAYAIPTVGLAIDDVSFGSSTLFGGMTIPDIDPGDLSRIEVLRGPQGTLYGANTLSGLLKYVTKDPSADDYSGRVEVGTSSVYNGTQPGFSLRASANIPLTDSLAVRVSGFKRQDPGYVDNPVLKQKGVNLADADGARLSALWQVSDWVSLKVNALYQDIRADGVSDVQLLPGLRDLQQGFISGTGQNDSAIQAYSAILKATLWDVDLISITGYNINRHSDVGDFTSVLGPQTQTLFGVPGTVLVTGKTATKFSQELRLSGVLGTSFEWMVGAFDTDETVHQRQTRFAQDITTGAYVGVLQDAVFAPITYHEYAGFANLTYHFTDQIDVQVGARASQNDQSFGERYTGKLYPIPFIVPKVTVNDDAFTYLVTPRYKVSPDVMVYARFATGYRPGGPNYYPGVPAQYAQYTHDTTINYEVGIKGDFFDHVLSVDGSLYYIDWKDIQFNLKAPDGLNFYIANAGRAKSQGVELAATVRPITSLTIEGWIDYDDAVLTQALPATSQVPGAPGDRLPNTSRLSGNLSITQDFPISGDVSGFVGGEVSYVGQRVGNFKAPPRQNFPAYTRTDLRAGVIYDTWTGNFFVTNVADVRGILNGGFDYPVGAYSYIQPRTFGVSVTKTF